MEIKAHVSSMWAKACMLMIVRVIRLDMTTPSLVEGKSWYITFNLYYNYNISCRYIADCCTLFVLFKCLFSDSQRTSGKLFC